MRTKWFTTVSLALFMALALSLFALPGAAPAAAQACGAVHTTDLSSWDLSQTRATGHNELVDGGLHIWTEGSTTTDKAAGYYPLAVNLSTITSGVMNYTPTAGSIPPSLQIVIDADANGTPDGILVGEASFYGANWWLSNGSAAFVKAGAPHHGDGVDFQGNGSNWWGTLTEWATSFPNARTVQIGYSLGSGVLGDGVITSMTFGCHIYTFGLPGAPVPEAALPPVAGFTCRVMVDAPMTGPLYAEKLLGQEWSAWNGFVVQDLDKHGGIEISLHHHDGEYSGYAYYRIIGQNGGEVRYFAQTDLPGICVEVSDPLA
ncbi:MAG: hypothetical protein JNL34_06210 [Anaerolineae bacterium]|nr:hypothetical protein [Anaerolineae bacterium]